MFYFAPWLQHLNFTLGRPSSVPWVDFTLNSELDLDYYFLFIYPLPGASIAL
jgi:hypothetical protein